ncbi:TPA: helix-turn-helix domain-containing protein [Bacillus paranthracis]
MLKSFDEIYCLLKRGKWENDKSCPDIDNLILLSEMYNVTLDELIKGNQNIKEKIQVVVLVIALFMMVFYSDVKKVILNEFKSFFKRKDIYEKK